MKKATKILSRGYLKGEHLGYITLKSLSVVFYQNILHRLKSHPFNVSSTCTVLFGSLQDKIRVLITTVTSFVENLSYVTILLGCPSKGRKAGHTARMRLTLTSAWAML
jgi:hypothetical protein